MLLYLCRDPDWDVEKVTRINRKKNGHLFKYSDTLFMVLAGIRRAGDLSHRMYQGIAVKALGRDNAPDHIAIHRRIDSMDILGDGTMCPSATKQACRA